MEDSHETIWKNFSCRPVCPHPGAGERRGAGGRKQPHHRAARPGFSAGRRRRARARRPVFHAEPAERRRISAPGGGRRAPRHGHGPPGRADFALYGRPGRAICAANGRGAGILGCAFAIQRAILAGSAGWLDGRAANRHSRRCGGGNPGRNAPGPPVRRFHERAGTGRTPGRAFARGASRLIGRGGHARRFG